MTDKELLELAAKAAGIPIYEWVWRELDDTWHGARSDSEEATVYWSSRDDDGDCARMEEKLSIDIDWCDDCVYSDSTCEYYSDHAGNRQAARRLASTRAAAEIGKGMK